MSEILSTEELLETVNNIIDFLTEREDSFYVALEVAHQLHDEIIQGTPDDGDNE